MKIPIVLIAIGLAVIASPATAQLNLNFDGSIPVQGIDGTLDLGWAGGFNSPQTSAIDLNGDGLKDLFFFDRSGNSVVTLLNNGMPGSLGYTVTRAYDHVYPLDQLHDWALMRDYNCDGREDLFTYTNAGFVVYKNISDANGLAFVQVVQDNVQSDYVSTNGNVTRTNLYVPRSDIPGIVDIDGDGDLDILAFSLVGSYVHYHKNLSMETYGNCDSLKFELLNSCWGYFSENANNNSVTLGVPCDYNVPAPEMGLEDPVALEDDDIRTKAHAGSSLLPLDLDGDGVMELLLGDISFNNIVALYNGGTVTNGLMTSEDTLFPSYNTPVDLPLFPGMYYEDMDKDGKRDLVVSPNAENLARNVNSNWFYKNIGTDAAPLFNKIQEDLFQGRMIDLGEGAFPVAFDHDGDGSMDLLVSNYGYYDPSGTYVGAVAYFRNTGTLLAPSFQLMDLDYMGLSSSGIGPNMYLAFTDLDGDGDKDLYIGDLQGRLHFYRNTPTNGIAQFALITPNIPDVNGDVIDVGQFATPQFTDMDGDGLNDLIIGERNGNLNYYRNTGNASAPQWTFVTDALGGVSTIVGQNVTGHSVPVMYTSPSGSREMLLGSESGWLYYYANIDGNISGSWTLMDSTFLDIRDGERTAPLLYDYTGDGRLDMFLGNLRGGLSFWNSTNITGIEDQSTAQNYFGIQPNPATDQVELVLTKTPAKGVNWTVTNSLGQIVHRQQALSLRTKVDVAQLSKGIYFVRLEGMHAQRLVILK